MFLGIQKATGAKTAFSLHLAIRHPLVFAHPNCVDDDNALGQIGELHLLEDLFSHKLVELLPVGRFEVLPVVDQLLLGQGVRVGDDSEDEAIREVDVEVCRLLAVEVKKVVLLVDLGFFGLLLRPSIFKFIPNWCRLQDDLLGSLQHPPNRSLM